MNSAFHFNYLLDDFKVFLHQIQLCTSVNNPLFQNLSYWTSGFTEEITDVRVVRRVNVTPSPQN